MTKNYQTSSYVKTYAANDAGNYVGRSTAYLKDNIRYKGKFISKNSLPNAPKLKILGAFNFLTSLESAAGAFFVGSLMFLISVLFGLFRNIFLPLRLVNYNISYTSFY